MKEFNQIYKESSDLEKNPRWIEQSDFKLFHMYNQIYSKIGWFYLIIAVVVIENYNINSESHINMCYVV